VRVSIDVSDDGMPVGIDLRLMRYVVAIADEGGFQDAADWLGIAQSALSRQVGQLEHDLGFDLFHRRPTRLTDAGGVFVEQARRILSQVEQAVRRTRLVAAGEVGTLRLGYTVSTTFEVIPKLLDAFHAEYSGITVRGSELWDAELVAALEAGQVDLAIGRGLPDHPGFDRVLLRREPPAVALRSDHPLADQGSIALRDLRGETVRTFPRHLAPEYYDFVLTALHSTGEIFEIWHNPHPNLRNLSVRDLGGFMFLALSVGEGFPKGVTTIPLADPLPPIVLEALWKPESLSPQGKLLLRTARRLAEALGWLAEEAPRFDAVDAASQYA
jgi:DNA-binding transcriptional LysR family regulator